MKSIRLALLTAVLAAPVAAQEPPAPPAPEPPPPLWSGKAELAYAATTGNTSTSSFGLGLEVVYRPAPWAVEGKFAFLRAETTSPCRASERPTPSPRPPSSRSSS
jgi:putative salt-induced outer membrane protein YdiY